MTRKLSERRRSTKGSPPSVKPVSPVPYDLEPRDSNTQSEQDEDQIFARNAANKDKDIYIRKHSKKHMEGVIVENSEYSDKESLRKNIN